MDDRRPRYVQTLDRERRQAQAELAALEDGLTDLRRYLHSTKFAAPGDGYVNRDDVLLRLDEARSHALDAAAAAA